MFCNVQFRVRFKVKYTNIKKQKIKRENIKVFLSPQEVWGPVLTAPTSALERSPIQVPAADLGCLTLVILGNWCLYSKFTVLYI